MDEEKQELREESRSLSFKDILFILRKNWIAIVIFLVAGTIAGFSWTKVQQKVSPVYQASGIIMVSPEKGSSSQTAAQDYALSNNLTETVVAFIKTNAVLDDVRNGNYFTDAEGNAITPSTYEGKFNIKKLSLSNSSNNLMVNIKYSSKDKDESVRMVNAVMDAAVAEADRMKDDQPTVPVYHMLNGNLNIVDRAQKSTQESNTLRNTALGFAAGVVVAAAYTFIKELSDNTFKSSEEIERTLNIPVLAGIPDYHFDDEKKGGK